jgi:hypothetical protein
MEHCHIKFTLDKAAQNKNALLEYARSYIVIFDKITTRCFRKKRHVDDNVKPLSCFIAGAPRIEIQCMSIQIRNFLRLGMAGGDGGLWHV